MSALNSLLYPTTVAVVGSASAGKLGAVLAQRIENGGFRKLCCVNPKGQGIGEIPGYRSFAEIGAPVDMMIVASPAATVPDTFRDAKRAGVKAAVVISSGFSEAGNHELEQALKAAAAETGIRYVGPNCAGIVNTAHNLIATLEAEPLKGRVSLISQSGAIGGMVMEMARREGLGFGKFLSFGNGTDLNQDELLRYLAGDADTDVIAMYLENIRDGRAFMDALRTATAKKPVVIIKSGRTEGGQRAARSHTGAMAGADAVYEAAFQKCGAIRADSADQMIDLCKALLIRNRLQGANVAVITNSGGPGVLTADRLETLGLHVLAPSDALKARLKEFLPAFSGLSNPLDITVEGTAEQYERTLALALEEYDAAIVIDIGTPYLAAMPVAEALCKAAAASQKPVLAYFEVGKDIEQARETLRNGGIPCFGSGERAADGLRGLARRSNPVPQAIVETVQTQKLGKDFLTEPDCMDILDGLGIPTPKRALIQSRTEAAKAAAEIGYPVCMKIVSRDIIHKSDVGGVKLNVQNAEQAENAFDALEAICLGKHFGGVLIYPMLKTGPEVIFGLVRDPQFGPAAAVGLGGIFTETLKDIALCPAPVSREEAMQMLRSLKAFKLLTGARGKKPCDVEALAEILAKLSKLPFLYEEIAEVDLNPVFAYENGALTADARMLLQK